MENFHEHKLWQDAYVALMDIHRALDTVEVTQQDKEVVEELLEAAQKVAATIADGLTRQDRRIARDCMYNAVGLVAMTRTHLAVAWGRQLVDDESFKKLDTQYADLSSRLQQYR